MTSSDSGKNKDKAPSRGLGRGLSSLLGDAAISSVLNDQDNGQAQSDAIASKKVAKDAQHLSGAQQNEGNPAEKAPLATPTSAPILATAPPRDAIRKLPLEWINPGPWQPRRIFDTLALQELANSMQQQGLVQPILVRENPDQKGRYQIIAGERRWRAAQIAQLHDVPVIIRDLSDRDAAEISIVENIQRRDLSAIEEAEGYQRLINEHGYTQQELAGIMGKSRPHIANLLRLLQLPAWVQEALIEGQLTVGQVRPLIGHEDMDALARSVMDKGLSAREVERMVKLSTNAAQKAEQETRDIAGDIAMRDLEKRAADQLGLKIQLQWNPKTEKGQMKIKTETLEQFEDVLARLGLKTDH